MWAIKDKDCMRFLMESNPLLERVLDREILQGEQDSRSWMKLCQVQDNKFVLEVEYPYLTRVCSEGLIF
jgi:hypothetical protein